jgi:hypothetical protein
MHSYRNTPRTKPIAPNRMLFKQAETNRMIFPTSDVFTLDSEYPIDFTPTMSGKHFSQPAILCKSENHTFLDILLFLRRNGSRWMRERQTVLCRPLRGCRNSMGTFEAPRGVVGQFLILLKNLVESKGNEFLGIKTPCLPSKSPWRASWRNNFHNIF